MGAGHLCKCLCHTGDLAVRLKREARLRTGTVYPPCNRHSIVRINSTSRVAHRRGLLRRAAAAAAAHVRAHAVGQVQVVHLGHG
eukprot:scaffold42786_cov36-Phaeocystis_antarctica.AAC.1